MNDESEVSIDYVSFHVHSKRTFPLTMCFISYMYIAAQHILNM